MKSYPNNHMLSLFQTASGGWHWASIMLLIGWLVGGIVGGAIIYVNLRINLRDRLDASAKEVADFNAFGHRSGISIMGNPAVKTAISNWSAGFLTREKGQLIWKCDALSAEKCRETIQSMPNYPYFFLAVFKKESGDPTWKRDCSIAIAIFERTIRVSGHHPDHDIILDAAKALATPRFKAVKTPNNALEPTSTSVTSPSISGGTAQRSNQAAGSEPLTEA